MKMLWKPQEISVSDPQSHYRFSPSEAKPFLAAPAALEAYGVVVILSCLRQLQQGAVRHGGIDYLQVFEPVAEKGQEPLWFIEDDEGGAITALLPSDY